MIHTLETVTRRSTAALPPRSAVAADLSEVIADATGGHPETPPHSETPRGHFSKAAATEVDVDGALIARPSTMATVTAAATKGAAAVGDGRSRQPKSHAP